MTSKKTPEITQTERLPDWRNHIGSTEDMAAWRTLIATSRMPQVLLLDGRQGCGKRALLAAMVAMHFCADGRACGECDGCKLVLSGNHPEVLWLESTDGKYRIEDAANIQEHLSYAPGGNARDRIVVIVDADKLIMQAANRLLKTLEEPPEWARVYMSTSRLDAILPTVLSRCVRWKVKPPPEHVATQFLRGAFERAGREVPSDDDLFDLLKRSGLTPGKALHRAGLELGGEHKEGLSERLAALLQSTSVYSAVEAAAAIVDGSRPDLAELLEELEIELNNQYWQAFHKNVRPDLVTIKKRRELLKQIRFLAVKNKIALNAQMVFESIGHPTTT